MTKRSEERLRIGVAVIVTAAWLASFVADLVIDGYNPPGSVSVLMLLVAGSLFGENVVRKVRENGTNG